MTRKQRLLLLCYCLISCSTFAQKDYARLVNPFIGTGGHGHTYPGASMPFGMVQLSPDTRLEGWDGCSGYHYSDSIIYGFSHTHLSGTGVEDYCDVLMMPTTGDYQWQNKNYASPFSHASEKAFAGYYSVFLDKYQVKAELTATPRAGMHQYSFPENAKEGNILIDLKHRDKVVDSWIEIVDDHTIRGMRQSEGWAKKQTLFFVVKFSRPFIKHTIAVNDLPQEGIKKATGTSIKTYISFALEPGKPLIAKTGISAVDANGALNNLQQEIPGFNFEAVKQKAVNTWNRELAKIEVSGGNKNDQAIFYTALYHACLNPNLYTDADGRYRTTNDSVYTNRLQQKNPFTNYTVFSLWDTYRALHPLMTIINRKKTSDWINTFLVQHKRGGMLPVWELSANETFCMIGYHSVSVIADAYAKGIRGFDTKEALNAMRAYAESNRFGLEDYRKNGFLSFENEPESVSKTLEYAYNDWCIAQFAKMTGKMDVYKTYIRRAQNYKNIMDPATRFARGRKEGMWHSPFNPTEVNNYFTEANAWQYSFSVPQDINGLLKLHGGKDGFVKKLDTLFTTASRLSGREQSDITGLIGQYAHGNEPSHHISYLYNYAGRPWQTQEKIHEICSTLYHNAPDGLSGNEDCGQMSAWYVLSAMGFYDICPGKGQYTIGTPRFDQVKINLENGKQFIISAPNRTEQNFYIQSATLNGRPLNKSYFSANNIAMGGSLSFNMGSQPNRQWATEKENIPATTITDYPIVAAPYIIAGTNKFKDSMLIAIKSPDPSASIRFSLESNNIFSDNILYRVPFTLHHSAKLTFKAFVNKQSSGTIVANFYKIPSDKSITITSKVNPLYDAGGADALIDGIRAKPRFSMGDWQSYYGNDFEAVVDLKTIRPVHYIATGHLQDVGVWIWMPGEVQFETSEDGVHYTPAGIVKNEVDEKQYGSIVKDFGLKVNLNARYIRIKAMNHGAIPAWHPGAGNPAHIFIDEVIVE
jgi:predicted alpha-1,2-mannosidase